MVEQLSSTTPDDVSAISRGSKVDVEYHELHLDERCPGDIYIDEMVESHSSSKALVVPTEREYMEWVGGVVSFKRDYYDVYWCTHTFNHKSGKLVKISAARLRSIISTPNSRKSKKKKQAPSPAPRPNQLYKSHSHSFGATVSPMVYDQISNLQVTKLSLNDI